MKLSPNAIRNRLAYAADELKSVAVMHRAGVIDLTRPDRILRISRETRTYGPHSAMIMRGAREHPEAAALTDERGTLTYRELDRQSNALANALKAAGLTPGSVVGVLARDHRGLVLAISAAGRAGLRLAMLNTGFAKPQFAQVVEREQVRAVLHDSEFGDLLDALPPELPRYLTWVDKEHRIPVGSRTLDEVIAAGDPRTPPPPPHPGGFIILTSGTTGLPKGAPRTRVSPLVSALFLDRIPVPRLGTAVIVSPLFHGTGFSLWGIATSLANETVVMRRFDAEATLRALAENRAHMLVAVPTMLHRMVSLGPEVIGKHDLSALRVIVVAGSALSPELAVRAQDAFGDVLYNFYGSTEVSIASVAQPHELRAAPGTVGRAPVATRIALFDDEDRKLDGVGVRGRVFVRSTAPFEGYTDGRTKQILDGYMSTGDMGHFDVTGLLFIDGRDDDMVVSGGENVYPLEVENLLAELPGVDEVAVIGVDDEDFGKRLRAIIVRTPDTDLDAQAIKDHVKANLARYKVPRDVIFTAELPRNATGKILRRELPAVGAH